MSPLYSLQHERLLSVFEVALSMEMKQRWKTADDTDAIQHREQLDVDYRFVVIVQGLVDGRYFSWNVNNLQIEIRMQTVLLVVELLHLLFMIIFDSEGDYDRADMTALNTDTILTDILIESEWERARQNDPRELAALVCFRWNWRRLFHQLWLNNNH